MNNKKTDSMNSKQVNDIRETYQALSTLVSKSKGQFLEINLIEGKGKAKLPKSAVEKLNKILKEMIENESLSIDDENQVLTTQQAADIIGCSRPHLVKLLEKGEIKYYKVGKHRRVLEKDVLAYKNKLKEKQKDFIEKMIKEDEELGLYD